MGEETVDRSAFIARVGTFFILVGLFSMILFIASDATRNIPERMPHVTETYIVQAIEALQTRDAGAATVLAFDPNAQTPTLEPPPIVREADTGTYIPLFCLGIFGLGAGWLLWRTGAQPRASSGRFAGIRNIMQKQREAKAKREAARKEKEEQKKQAKK